MKLVILWYLIPKFLFGIAASVADAAGFNPDGIKTFSENGFSTFFTKGKPVFSNGPKILLRNSPDYYILCNKVFDNFILAEKPFAKALRSLEACVLVNNNLCVKLVL